MADKNKKERQNPNGVFCPKIVHLLFQNSNMNSDKISTTGARDSEKKTMVASIVYTVYVTEKRGYQVNID